MSERDLDEKGREGGAPGAESDAGQSDERASTPFDHPAFLPVLLIAFTVWFGYDGWFNESTESVRFNRYGFGFLIGAASYFSLVELTRMRFLLPLLLVGYAVWLGALELLGPADAWYKDVESARLFNRYAALGSLALAALAALRELIVGRRAARGA